MILCVSVEKCTGVICVFSIESKPRKSSVQLSYFVSLSIHGPLLKSGHKVGPSICGVVSPLVNALMPYNVSVSIRLQKTEQKQGWLFFQDITTLFLCDTVL